MRRYLLLLLSLLTIHYSLFTLVTPVFAQTPWSTGGDDACVAKGDVATIKGIQCLISNFLSVALQLLGIVLLIMLVMGGVKYLTSGGDAKATDAAKGTISAAIGGLVLAILSWFILRLIQDITGVKVTIFQWPSL